MTEQAYEAGGVRGVLHTPGKGNGAGIALAHGAGSNCNAPLLVQLSRAFCEAGCVVLRYDLPFRQIRPGGPPFPAYAAKDREGIQSAIAAVRGMAKGRIIAGGHSYGGRQTAMTAAEHPEVAEQLLLLSYPLHPPKRPEQKRTAYFPELRTPALFVHGTADAFGTPDELREALTLISARTELLLVEGAGHDLRKAGALAGEILSRLMLS